jgi:hypothetical protein
MPTAGKWKSDSAFILLPSSFILLPSALFERFSPMPIVYYSLLLLILLAGLVLTVVTLPGTWLMLLGFTAYAVVTRSAGYVGWKSVMTLFLLATLAELFDIFGSGAGAKKAGASRRAMFGAVVGGLLGAIFLSFLLFFPVGTIAGACIGCFVGAGIVELFVRRDIGQSVRVGFHAAKGRLLGIILKILVALLMMSIAAWTALPRRARLPIPTPLLRPATTSVAACP